MCSFCACGAALRVSPVFVNRLMHLKIVQIVCYCTELAENVGILISHKL
jgi:hypothetical protein